MSSSSSSLSTTPLFADPILVWKLYSELLTALAVALALQLVIFPGYSQLELHWRWWQSWRLLERLIASTIQTYMAPDVDRLQARKADFDTFRRSARANLAQMKARAGESQLERAFIPSIYSLYPFYFMYPSHLAWLDPMQHIPLVEQLLDVVDHLSLCLAHRSYPVSFTLNSSIGWINLCNSSHAVCDCWLWLSVR